MGRKRKRKASEEENSANKKPKIEYPTLEEFQKQIDEIISAQEKRIKTKRETYNRLLSYCAHYHELAAAVYLYECLRRDGYAPTKETYKHLEPMSKNNFEDKSSLKLPPRPDTKNGRMEPKKRIQKIVNYRQQSEKYSRAVELLPEIVEWLKSHKEQVEKCKSRFKLCKLITANFKHLNISSKFSPWIVTALKKKGYIKEANKKITLLDNVLNLKV